MRLVSLMISLAAIAGLADFCCAAGSSVDFDEMKIFDTVTSYDSPLSSSEIKNKLGWKQIRDANISGDLYVENSKMAVILRKNSVGSEVYYKISDSHIKAITLYPVGEANEPVTNIESFKVISRDESHVLLNTLFHTESGEIISLEYVIRPGQATIEMRPGKGAHKIIIRAKSSYTIMPDLFADDVVIDLQNVKDDRLYIPEDNHLLLQMIDNGDAIIVCNWLSSYGEVVIASSNSNGKETDPEKLITETIISFQNNNKIWVSLMAQKGIWHRSDTSGLNIYEHTLLDWTVPFPAYWRANYRRADSKASGLIDSFWNAETQDDGTFKLVPSLLETDIIDGQYIIADPGEQKRLVRRSVINQHTGSGWWSYRGWFIQPFYINGDSAFIKIPRFSVRRTIRYSGPILIYPLLRVEGAYADGESVEDVLHNTFGPEYLSILDMADLNKRHEKDHFPPTCTTTEYCEKIFDRNEEIYRRNQIVAILGRMDLFVKYTRQRLQEYLDWEKEMRVLYQKSRQANPGLAGVVKIAERITRQIPRRFLIKSKSIKTPEYVSTLSSQIINLIDSDNLLKAQRHKQICRRIRSIGNAQDELLGEYRSIVKITRQKAGILHTQETDPEVRKFLRLIRAQTQKILRVRYDMEGK